jgi:hypothetical protein
MQDSWVYSNDTWIHPNILGHQQIAYVIMNAMCGKWQRWCLTADRRRGWERAAN